MVNFFGGESVNENARLTLSTQSEHLKDFIGYMNFFKPDNMNAKVYKEKENS